MPFVKNYVDQAVQTDSLLLGPLVMTDSLATLAEPLVPSPSTPRSSKRPQFLYSRPIEPHVLTKRVVSLPDSLFEVSCDLRVARDVSGIRVVSLPETMPWSPQSTDKNPYPDSCATSTDTSHTSSGIDYESRTYSKLDIPRTPSPPSSPESVLIIDNDIHLPNLFLYRHSHNIPVNEDDGGWITWASSPPRPIPALHGPLSLPYARCPSGAEGTIIEDADLPRMIWGLDLHTFRPGATRNQRTMNVHKPTGEDFSPILQAAPPKPQEQPSSTMYSPRLGRYNYADDAVPKREIANEDVNKSGCHHNLMDVLKPTLDQPRAYSLGRLKRREAHPASGCVDYRINEYPLRSSATVFIPATSEHMLPHSIESCTSQMIKPGTLAAIDIARQYYVDQQKNALLTPPTSSAPEWSSTFAGNTPCCQLDEWNFLQHQQHQQAPLNFSGAHTPGINHLTCSAKRDLGYQDTSHLVPDLTRGNSIHQHSLPNHLPQRKKCVDEKPMLPLNISLLPDTIHQTINFVSTPLSPLTTTAPFGTVEQRVSVPYNHSTSKHRRSSEDVRPSLKNVSLPMKSRQPVHEALNQPSERVVWLSNSHPALSRLGDLHTETPRSAGLSLGPKPGLDFETTRNEFPQNRKPIMEATPTVKLPLTRTMFSDIGRQDRAGAREEIGTHRGPGKENTSSANAKASNNTLPRRGRARKRNMNGSMVIDSQNNLE